MKPEELFRNPTAPLKKVSDNFISKSGVNLFIKRLDLNHPEISGNKWFKLKYNLIEAAKNNYKTLLTFGGAFSNHIYATAAAGRILNFKTIGVIRGEEHLPLNPTLAFVKKRGMEITYLNRTSYRDKYNSDFLSSLKSKYGNFYLIHEGGTNSLAIKGCKEIFDDINTPFDFICTACGTGGTLAGLISELKENQTAIGFPVLKGGGFLNNDINNLLKTSTGVENKNWQLITDYHFGGYAKIKDELIEFISEFEYRNGIKLEPIYSGKMLFGIYDLIKKDYFPKGSIIIALHNGGLQGLEGLKNKLYSRKIRKSDR